MLLASESTRPTPLLRTAIDGTNERRIDLFQAVCVSMLGSLIIVAIKPSLIVGIILTGVLVTIPVQIFKLVAFYSMACPCTIHDGSASSDAKKSCVSCVQNCGKCVRVSHSLLICHGIRN